MDNWGLIPMWAGAIWLAIGKGSPLREHAEKYPGTAALLVMLGVPAIAYLVL